MAQRGRRATFEAGNVRFAAQHDLRDMLEQAGYPGVAADYDEVSYLPSCRRWKSGRRK